MRAVALGPGPHRKGAGALIGTQHVGGAPEAVVVRYAAPFSLGRFFRALGETNQSKLQIELPKQFLPQLESGRAYFLPSYYAP